MFIQSGVSTRKALVLGLFSVLPDFDVLFGVHRSMSHSIVVWLVTVAPLYLYYWNRDRGHIRDPLLVLLAGGLHIVFDSGSFTPVLWPLMSSSYAVDFNLFVHVGKSVAFEPLIGVTSVPTDFVSFTGFDAPLFTSEAFVISFALLAPVVLQIFTENKKYWAYSDLVTRFSSLTRTLSHRVPGDED